MMIYCRVKKPKAKKVSKKVREQHQDWLNSVQSMTTNFSSKNPSNYRKKATKITKPDLVVRGVYVRETQKYESINTGIGNATKSAPKVYTGTAMKGIATMHKSNAVPVFTDDEAKDISSMRR